MPRASAVHTMARVLVAATEGMGVAMGMLLSNTRATHRPPRTHGLQNTGVTWLAVGKPVARIALPLHL
jgi:hypothetical protein